MTVFSANFRTIRQGLKLLVAANTAEEKRLPVLSKLAQVATELGSGSYRVPIVPPDYVLQWKEFRRGSGPAPNLRVTGRLCWEWKIATSEEFLEYLLETKYLRRKSTVGLVHSCHSAWSSKFAESKVREKIQELLERFKSPNLLLKKWQIQVRHVLTADGPTNLATELLKDLKSIEEGLTDLNISPVSPYAQQVAAELAKLCRIKGGFKATEVDYLFDEVLSWQGWTVDSLKAEISELILGALTEDNKDLRGKLMAFVREHPDFGDPRLPRNQKNWLGILRAQQRFIQWLTERDIVFFFEHVLPRGSDNQGRKKFWLQYLKALKWSRPLLSSSDQWRLRSLKNRLETTEYGLYSGQGGSAFLLHFGKLLIVEFSKVGAIYVYTDENIDKAIKNFWRSTPFRDGELKNLNLKSNWVSHHAGWQDVMTNILAYYRIRPQ